MSISKNKKIIIISGIVLLVALIALIFPKEISTCGYLADGSACMRHRCIGILTVNNNTPPRSTCNGIDLGEEDYFIPLN